MRLRTVCVLAAALVIGLLAGCSTDHESSFGASVSSAQGTPTPAAGGTGPLPITASGLLAGNITPKFPVGAPGKVSVVASGPLSAAGDTLPIAVRNNTGAAIAQVEVSAAGPGAGEKGKAAGKTQGTFPAVIEPGGVALAFVYFPQKQQKGLTYKFSITSAAPSTPPAGRATLKVTEATLVGDAVSGALQNTTGYALQGSFDVEVFCFSPAGKLTGVTGATAFGSPGATAAAGDQRAFNVNLYGLACNKFLVGGNGFFA